MSAVAVQLRALLVGTTELHREQITWRRPMLSASVTALVTAGCLVLGAPDLALSVALGAWFAGMADSGQPVGDYWRGMLWTTLWVSVGAVVGGFASEFGTVELIVVAIMAIACGFAGALGARGVLNGMLTLAVYAIFAGSPTSDRGAILLGLFVALGGLIQTLAVVLPAVIGHRGKLARTVERPERILARLRSHGQRDDDFLRHALRLSVAMVVASLFAQLSAWPHEYWIPMSVAWMARPDRFGTSTRVAQRILGTVVGIVAAVVMIDDLNLHQYGLVIVIGLGVLISLAFLRANYSIAVIGITLAVIALFSIQGDSVGETAPSRIASTLVAGVITVLASFLWPSNAHSQSATSRE
jgi:uncharacterized membrane protein YccC